MLLLYISLFFVGNVFSVVAYAQDEVHFGTIFVEDIEYQNSDENEQINFLTDQSSKQQQLETLYQKEIGQTNQKLKKIDLQQRKPASLNKKSTTPTENKVGVIRNSELPKQIVYFLELRSFAGNSAVKVNVRPNPTSPQVITLQPGELVKITDTPAQYLHKLRMDRDNQGLWKTIATREQDIKKPNLYYDWRNFETITSHDFPIELDVLVPYGKNSIPVFNKPGAWTWKDCGLTESLCIDNIDLHTKAYLFDATIVDTQLAENLPADYRLFYKIGYQHKNKDGLTQHKVGWIPSNHAKRKISQLPKSLIATRTPNSFGSYESDQERLQRLQKYYVFQGNLNSDNKQMSRWIDSTPGQTTEVFFQNLAFDGIAQANTFTLEQDFLNGQRFTQQGVAVGVGIYAPIFIDLEIQGSVTYTFPLTANEDNTFEKTPIFRGEQWLLYTTPISISDAPFKFGIGAYYLSMFSSQRNFGFNSLVGFQAKALVETATFWLGTRYGPTGQDFGFKLENREIGLDFGYRLQPERKYESWSIYGDYSDTAYTSSGAAQNKTKFQMLSIGVRKQF